GPRPTNAAPWLLWTRGKEAEQNTCYDLDDPPSTCRSPQLSRPIHAQPPTLSTVTTIRRSSEPKEPPRHRISTPPCHPAGEAATVELRKPPPHPATRPTMMDLG
ncbi:unnamed protein product, partial [Brassica oleracea]